MNSGLKKTVLYLGAFELPDKNAAAHRVISNGKILRNLGFQVYFIGFDKETDKNKEFEKTKVIVDEFVTYSLKAPNTYRDSISYLFNISRIEEFIQSRSPDVVIAYNYPFVALNRLLKLCTKLRIKLVADCTEWYDNPQGNLGYKLIKRLDMFYRIKVIQPKLDGVLTISKYLYDYYNKRMDNVLLLPPLVDKNDYKWAPVGNASKESEYKLVYAGSPGKGGKDRLDKVVMALIRIKENFDVKFQLNVIGITKEEFVSSFAFNHNELDLIVKFSGRLTHQNSLDIIKKADYFVFIRDKTLGNLAGFPTKFVEGIACGTPVLTNDTSNVLDYLVSGKNGYVLDDSSDEKLIQSILFALSVKKEKIIEMKTICRDDRTFDYRNYLETFNSFMQNILKND